jgi:hypothetical protein
MKVTKLIREYVEESVKAMPKFKDLTPEEVEYKALCDCTADFRNSLDNQLHDIVDNAIKEFRTLNNIPDEVEIKRSCYSATTISCYCTPLGDKARAAERKRVEARNDAIKDILLNLELGAGRKELDEMLKKLAE